jgi:hypothetical protein
VALAAADQGAVFFSSGASILAFTEERWTTLSFSKHLELTGLVSCEVTVVQH